MFFHLDKYGYFDEAAARFFVACTLLALQHVHSLGFVYRDVKPENLVLDDKGYLRMIDFGFAKRTDSARTYTACGTPDYQVRLFPNCANLLLLDRCDPSTFLQALHNDDSGINKHFLGIYFRFTGWASC